MLSLVSKKKRLNLKCVAVKSLFICYLVSWEVREKERTKKRRERERRRVGFRKVISVNRSVSGVILRLITVVSAFFATSSGFDLCIYLRFPLD